MIKVGLTGGIGCGKTETERCFEQLGVSVIDADQLAHQLSEKGTDCYTKIVALLGHAYLTENGSLNRKKIRQEVFNQAQRRAQLEAILHPAIRHALSEQIQALPNHKYCLLTIPLLIESGMDDLVDKIIVVECARETQLERVTQRDDCDRSQAIQIIASQASPEARRAKANFIIQNNEDLMALKERVRAIDQSLRAH